jgi:hypothetical protein
VDFKISVVDAVIDTRDDGIEAGLVAWNEITSLN